MSLNRPLSNSVCQSQINRPRSTPQWGVEQPCVGGLWLGSPPGHVMTSALRLNMNTGIEVYISDCLPSNPSTNSARLLHGPRLVCPALWFPTLLVFSVCSHQRKKNLPAHSRLIYQLGFLQAPPSGRAGSSGSTLALPSGALPPTFQPRGSTQSYRK